MRFTTLTGILSPFPSAVAQPLFPDFLPPSARERATAAVISGWAKKIGHESRESGFFLRRLSSSRLFSHSRLYCSPGSDTTAKTSFPFDANIRGIYARRARIVFSSPGFFFFYIATANLEDRSQSLRNSSPAFSQDHRSRARSRELCGFYIAHT